MKLRSIAQLFLTFTFLIGCQTVRSRDSGEMSGFEFHSAVWVNLHHYLYNEAFRPKAHQEPFTPFEPFEKEQIEKAIAFYKVKFDGRDLLFDIGLRKVNNELASAENKESLEGLDIRDGLREVLEKVRPIYLKRLWVNQNQENTRWIEDARRKLTQYGIPIREKLEKILKRQFIDVPYRIDVVHEANWAGAYTSGSPSHTVISSGRPNYSEYYSLEMIFHETLHAGPIDFVADALESEFKSRHMKDEDQLWHAIHFFTAGEVVREVLKSSGIDYVPYAYANKLFSEERKWGKFEPLIRKHWLPYMQGQIGMNESLKNLVDELTPQKVDYKSPFHDKEACLLIIQVSSGKTIEEFNETKCSERFSPNSTFKIPAALIAFETGILKNENQIIKWNGKLHARKELNQDQTPATWMDRSVVWVTQWMTSQLKSKAISKFLDGFGYGNHDFSGGPKEAWLDSSLKISPREQVIFLTKLWKNELPVSKASHEKTKKIIFIKNLGEATLYGKTGTGCIDPACMTTSGRMRGWFVGILKTNDDAYVFAANTHDSKPESSPAGPRLRENVIQALQNSGLTQN